MKKRLSVVNHLNVISIAYSSVLEIGDSNIIRPNANAVAIQREQEIFIGNEGSFHYPIFYRPIQRPIMNEQITFQRVNETPKIEVGKVLVTGASFSSVIQIGSSNLIQGESRVKHIRQLKDDGDEDEGTGNQI